MENEGEMHPLIFKIKSALGYLQHPWADLKLLLKIYMM